MMQERIRIVPSVLPADFSRLGAECARLEEAGVDRIQWDVMDGVFVPNLTLGPDIIASCRKDTSLGFEAHLMIQDPENSLSRYVDSGCEIIIVHVEATKHLHRTLNQIRSLGAKVGVALNPSTPISMVENVVDLLDLLLIMTVNPGFGGQKYIKTMEPKIRSAKELIKSSGYEIELEVDGGISSSTIRGAASSGANTLVAGSGLFSHPAGLRTATAELRQLATEALS